MYPTLLTVRYDAGFGNSLFVRGQHPLNWRGGTPLTSLGGDLWQIQLDLARPCQAKILLNDEEWSVGDNYLLKPARETEVYPYFEKREGNWVDHVEEFVYDEDLVRAWVYLPPSYDLNRSKYYPVLYCQDGQTLFSDDLARANSLAPVEWGLDEALNGLMNNGMMDEIIVVALEARHQGRHRGRDYAPFEDPDPYDGAGPDGGGAAEYASFLIGEVKARIDHKYRTKPERNGVLGASVGGLFAFFAGRKHPDVFERVACLSASWWWAMEEMLREVEDSEDHFSQKIYLDAGLIGEKERSGANQMLAMERALEADGYRQGVDLLTRRFRYGEHNELSWGSRVDVPMKFLYPWQDGEF